MSNRATRLKVTEFVPPRRAPAWWCAAWLALGALASGCTIQTVGSQPPPKTAPAGQHSTPTPAATGGGAAAAPARPSTGNQELTGLHSSVATNVATVRGLVDAVGQALRDPGLGAQSKRAHEQAGARAHAARQALNSGKHRLAQDEAGQAKRVLSPAVRELSDKSKLPDAVLKLLVAQADESRKGVASAMQALRATGNTAGLESYERASAAFTDAGAGARAGDGSRALRGLVAGSGQLERGTIARWPTLSTP